MLELHVSALESVLELKSILELDDIKFLEDIEIHNSPSEPTDIIYLILPTTHRQQLQYFSRKILLTGQRANLVILIEDDINIIGLDLNNFKAVAISDNKYYRDGNNFLVIDEENSYGATVKIEDSRLVNLYFYGRSLAFLGSKVSNELYVKLSGTNQTLTIGNTENLSRSLINSLQIEEQTSLEHLVLRDVIIRYQNKWPVVKKLYVDNVKVGFGTVNLYADIIENLTSFTSLGDEVRVRARKANIGSFFLPKVQFILM